MSQHNETLSGSPVDLVSGPLSPSPTDNVNTHHKLAKELLRLAAGTDDEQFMPTFGCVEHTWVEEGPLGIALREEIIGEETAVKVVEVDQSLWGSMVTGVYVMTINGECVQGKTLSEISEALYEAPRPLQMVFGDEDAYMELAGHYEHTWSEDGPLGLELKRGPYEVAVVSSIDDEQVARSLVPGVVVTEVAGESVRGLNLLRVVEKIKAAGRPLHMVFEKPLAGGVGKSLRHAGYFASKKVWNGEWTAKELQGLQLASMTVPIPFLSLPIKLISGGRTATVADPLFNLIGVDNFWTSSSENRIVSLALDGTLNRMLGKTSLIDFVEHTWDEEGALGLNLTPMSHRKGVSVGALLGGMSEGCDAPEGKLYNGLIVAEIEGEPVHDTPLKDISETLRKLPRPVTIKFADITRLKGLLYTYLVVVFGK